MTIDMQHDSTVYFDRMTSLPPAEFHFSPTLSEPLNALLKQSPYLRTNAAGQCRFLQAIRFGGSMFGIFAEQEAKILTQWATTSESSLAPITIPTDDVDDMAANKWQAFGKHGHYVAAYS